MLAVLTASIALGSFISGFLSLAALETGLGVFFTTIGVVLTIITLVLVFA